MAQELDDLMDAADWRYTRSFAPSELGGAAASAFVAQHGFLVVRDVLSLTECKSTRSEMWDMMEAGCPELDRTDKSTWPLWNARSFGMPCTDPIFSPQFLRNRCNPVLREAAALVMGAEQGEPLLVSHDRCAFYRPTADHPEFRTVDNLHLDLNPWRYVGDDAETRERVDGLRYSHTKEFVVENNLVTVSNDGVTAQAIINLLDNHAEDGGLQLVPGFHRRFSQWLEAMGPMPDEFSAPGAYRFPPGAEHGTRITLRPGSVCVWDQRLAHGSQGNRSDRPRAVQFARFFRASAVVPERAQARAQAVLRGVRSAGPELDQELLASGRTAREVLGLDQVL